MGARKRTQGKLKGDLKKKVDEGKKSTETENEAAKMEIDEPQEEVQKKDKLHQVIKKKKKIRVRRKGKKHGGVKFQILTLLKNEADSTGDKGSKVEGDKDSTVKNLEKLIKKRKNISKDLLNATYNWEIMFTGIPTKWNGNIEELTSDYKQYNLQACALKREIWDRQLCKILHLYFKTEKDMKKAVASGTREFLGMTLSLRINPVRMVCISRIPFDTKEDEAYSKLKETLGSGVYDITFPKNKEGKLLGYAVAYVLDEAVHKELLDGRTLNLWDGIQLCCTKEDFLKRFTVNVVSGWFGNVEILNELVKKLEALDIQVCVDLKTKKLYFLDESSVQRVLKESGLVVSGQKMIFSQSQCVRFVMKCITRHTPKSQILKLLEGIRAFNVQYNESRCKATFDVPAEEVEKCKALHQTELAGRKIEVYESGSEELKSAKEESRKRFEEYVVENNIKFRRGHRLHQLAKLYNQMKVSKPGKGNSKSKSKKEKTNNKISKKKFSAK